MGKMPHELRTVIAQNIRQCRINKYPGRGGSKRCADDFGVSPQQWSPWERGVRTPDEMRLMMIAEFFGVTVEWLRRDHDKAEAPEEEAAQPRRPLPEPPFTSPEAAHPMWRQSAPSSAASFFWLAHHLISHVQLNGLKIDAQSLEHLARLLRAQPKG